MQTKSIANRTGKDRVLLETILKIPRPVVAVARDYPSGYFIETHSHERSQLVYASNGVMRVQTGDGIWVVPPLRAVWIPAGIRHQIKMSGHVSMRTLYIDPASLPKAPAHCCLVTVSSLLKELILHAVDVPQPYPIDSPEERVMQVILDQIRTMDVKPLKLIVPKEERLSSIFKCLLEDPGDGRTLTQWGETVGATQRTLARLFKSETGMGFGQWRQQIRIIASLEKLAEGHPVTTVALDLGYNSPSAFISMFKKNLGNTPGQYFSKE